jgi:hypothetical protein
VLDEVDDLRWQGPTAAFPAWVARLGDDRLLARCEALRRRG